MSVDVALSSLSSGVVPLPVCPRSLSYSLVKYPEVLGCSLVSVLVSSPSLPELSQAFRPLSRSFLFPGVVLSSSSDSYLASLCSENNFLALFGTLIIKLSGMSRPAMSSARLL